MDEGFQHSWTMKTTVLVHEASDPIDPGNLRTIIVGHKLAKLYGSVLNSTIEQTELLRAHG